MRSAHSRRGGGGGRGKVEGGWEEMTVNVLSGRSKEVALLQLHMYSPAFSEEDT